MKEERNALQREVFPKLRKLCMEHGFRFQAIDLRWGVSEEAGLDQQTMKICLEEIERSQKVSPKPNFIVLLGDRYGWRPLPYEIPADEFEEIKSVIKDEDDRRFLFWEGNVLKDDQLKKREGWYCLDENAVPPVYCLKPRLVDYGENASDAEIKKARDLEYGDWETIEKRLKSLLLNAIDELGWGKDDSRRFKYESSATEQEIIKGVLNLPEDGSLSEEHVFSFMRTIKGKKGIHFDDHSKDFFDFTAAGTIDVSAEEKLVALKDKIDDKLPSSNLFNYETEWEGKGVSSKHIEKICDDVYYSLKKLIHEQINKFEDKYPLNIEITAHKKFGEERCKFFIGRDDNLAQIKYYMKKPNFKPLIIYGDSGSGKSALMAKTVEDSYLDFYETPVDNIIVRYIGATPESSDMRSLLESLSKQISRVYGEEDSNIPSDYIELVKHFKELLNLAKDGKPLLIFLDALDQLSDSENAHNLSWIPDELPENVHIVISTLKNIFQSSLKQRIIAENTVEVLPLEKNEGRTILDSWFQDLKRKLTDKQENEIINKFKVKGLPLYLKFAFEEAKLWKSYTPVPELESDIKWMINNLFERLSRPENHGEILVSRSLSYLSAAKNGLTEDEMLDILTSDDDVFSLTKKFHKPEEKKLPVALWSRLYFDLEPYLTERSADETSLMAFYHRQLGEVVEEKYLDNTVQKSRHQLIAEYFYKQDLYFEQDEERIYNIRKVSELPYNQNFGSQWDDLEETLTDLHFIEAKCAASRTYELIKDYNLALEYHPEAQEEIQQKKEYDKRVAKYTQDLIKYTKGEIETLEIIPTVKKLSNEKIKNNSERIINNPTHLDRIKVFSHFVKSQSHLLIKFGYIPNFCLQQAHNYATTNIVTRSAMKIINENSIPVILKNESCLPIYSPHDAKLKTLTGHTKAINAVDITPNGKKAISGSDDNTIRIWDLETGENIKTLTGHTKKVIAVAITPDGQKAISTSWDDTLRVWDLETSKNIKTLTGHTEFRYKVAVTPDGKKAISRDDVGTLSVLDLETGKYILKLLDHTERVNRVAVTPDGKKALCSEHNIVRVWDLETGENIKTLTGHTKDVNKLVLTPDGKKAISGSDDNTIRVWDLETGKNIKTLTGHTKKVIAVAITPDGKKIITGSKDNTARIWDIETGKNIKTLTGHTKDVNKLVLTPDGKKIITGSKDNTARIWDIETGKNIQILTSHTQSINVAVTPDGKKAISTSKDENLRVWNSLDLRVWDLETGENIKTIKELPYHEPYLSVSPDSKIAIIGERTDFNFNTGYRAYSAWNLETGKKEHYRRGNTLFTATIYAVAVTPEGKKAISGEYNIVRVWDLETGENIQILSGHTKDVLDVAITPDGQKAITRSRDTVLIWDLKNGKNIKTFTLNYKIFLDSFHLLLMDLETSENIDKLPTVKDLISELFVTHNDKKAISGYQKTLFLWSWENDLDYETKKMIKTLTGHEDTINSIAVTPDGKKAITGDTEGNICVWDLETGEFIKTTPGHKDRIYAMAVTPDGKKAITGSNDNSLRWWDIKTCTNTKISTKEPILITTMTGNAICLSRLGENAIFDSQNNTVHSWDPETGKNFEKLVGNITLSNLVVVTPDGKKAASIDKTVRIWDLETGEFIKTTPGHKDTINSIAVTPDGRKGITGDDKGNVCVWGLETGKLIKTLQGHTQSIKAVTVTPDGKKAISTSWDDTLRVWDLETGKNIKTLTNHTKSIKAVAVTPDGKKIISGSADGTVRIRDLKTNELVTLTKEKYEISSLTLNTECCLVFSSGNDIIFSRLFNIIDLPLVTAVRIRLLNHEKVFRLGLFKNKKVYSSWDGSVKSKCYWCGNYFKVENEILKTIKNIEKQYKKSNGWISDEAWEDPKLISECPCCHEKLKFNPFVVDNSEGEFDYNEAIEDLNENSITEKPRKNNEKKKSHWKFWK